MTANLLHKISNLDCLEAFSIKIMLFSQQLVHRVPTFSCGCFTFDFSLGFKVCVEIFKLYLDFNSSKNFQMISAAAVYLTILIQFEIPGINEESASLNMTGN